MIIFSTFVFSNLVLEDLPIYLYISNTSTESCTFEKWITTYKEIFLTSRKLDWKNSSILRKNSKKGYIELPFIPILSESFRFSPEKWPHSDFPIFLWWFRFFNGSDSDNWKSSFSGNSSLRKRRGSLKEPWQPPKKKKRKKILRTIPSQPWLDLTVEIHQFGCWTD